MLKILENPLPSSDINKFSYKAELITSPNSICMKGVYLLNYLKCKFLYYFSRGEEK